MSLPDPHAEDARLVAETLGAGWTCTAGRRLGWGEALFLCPPGESHQTLAPESPAWRALAHLARQLAAWKDGHAEYRARVKEHAAKAVRAIGDLAQ